VREALDLHANLSSSRIMMKGIPAQGAPTRRILSMILPAVCLNHVDATEEQRALNLKQDIQTWRQGREDNRTHGAHHSVSSLALPLRLTRRG